MKGTSVLSTARHARGDQALGAATPCIRGLGSSYPFGISPIPKQLRIPVGNPPHPPQHAFRLVVLQYALLASLGIASLALGPDFVCPCAPSPFDIWFAIGLELAPGCCRK
eukprot:316676-Chlamydomonas_euryale.AAC.1